MNSPTEPQLGAAFRDLVAEQPFTPDVSAIEHRARLGRAGRPGRDCDGRADGRDRGDGNGPGTADGDPAALAVMAGPVLDG